MSVSDELGKLGELHQRGQLSDEEFARAKARVLDGTCAARAVPPANPLQAMQRDAYDRWLGGVCGGLGRATGLPSWTWRLIFVFGMVFAGSGLLAYLLLWIFMPPAPLYLPAPRDPAQAG